MATIHKTTLSPSKLELLTDWMPSKAWYLPTGSKPELVKSGGFRLDDPLGEVGIEFMVVTDTSGNIVAAYLVPLTYRAGALAGADSGLIGIAEHGVLGRRWIYDGVHDPVLVAQLVALIQGKAEAQAQSVSDTPDPSVTGSPVTDGALTVTHFMVAADGLSGTALRLETAGGSDSRAGQLHVRINRSLRPGDGTAADQEAGAPCLTATWRLTNDMQVGGVLAVARYTRR